jgi:hypothetical protein
MMFLLSIAILNRFEPVTYTIYQKAFLNRFKAKIDIFNVFKKVDLEKWKKWKKWIKNWDKKVFT